MNYLKIYNNLINCVRMNNTEDNVYYEEHHILPRCMGGDNSKDNLVKMTPEQHYVAHQLLVKIYPSVNGLWYSCKMMARDLQGKRPNNKLYGWIRKNVNIKHAEDIRNSWAIKRKPVEIDGVFYPSVKEAYETLGMTRNQINYRLDSDNYPNYVRLKEK